MDDNTEWSEPITTGRPEWLGCISTTGLVWNEYTGDWERTPIPEAFLKAFPDW